MDGGVSPPLLYEEIDQVAPAILRFRHADRVTRLRDLREATDCLAAMGELTRAECVNDAIRQGDVPNVAGVKLDAIYTPTTPTNPSASCSIRRTRKRGSPATCR